jgi:4-amino-4-deoxy-L-arabinose transferase-like glycosyltransferase
VGRRYLAAFLRRHGGTAAILRRHWGIATLVIAGALLRLALTFYAPSFWFSADSGQYLDAANHHFPNSLRPYGYSAFLVLAQPLPLRAVVVLQHLAGLGIAVAGYAFLQRRGVSRVVAAVAMAPLLLDARTAVLEHYLLAETAFIALVFVGLLLCCRAGAGWRVYAGAGAILAAAALTRTVGLVVLVLAGLFLLVRRVGWRHVGAFVIAAALPILGYCVWYQQKTGDFSIGTYGGRLLFARTATFVECDRLDLTEVQARICPTEPLDQRKHPEEYLWPETSANMILNDQAYDEEFSGLARKAILAQPLDYARTVVVDTLMFLSPVAPDGARPGYDPARFACLDGLSRVPPPSGSALCQPLVGLGSVSQWERGAQVGEQPRPFAQFLGAYSTVASVPTTMIALAALVVVVLMAWGRQRLRWRDAVEPLLWTGVGLGLVVTAVATSALDPRYAVPALPFVLVGAALAAGRFSTLRRGAMGASRPVAPEPRPDADPVPAAFSS